ncbi:hypothetical protein FTO74_07965 [Granulicella sp. WH15]|nr:hypothetical protein FTO74_07965 [Granulicella sp. WH15]
MSRQFVRCWLLLAGMAMGVVLCGSRAEAQRPILPICSDDPAFKLPPCKAAPGSEPQQQGQSVSTDGAGAPASPATAFPFPGDPAPASPEAPKPAAEQFPFPGSDPAPAQPAAAAPAAPAVPQPAASAPSAGGKSGASGAKDAFPFPGENVPLPVVDPNEKVYDPNEGKAGPPTPRPAAPPDNSGSSSSSSSDAEPLPDLKDEGSEGSTASQRRRMPKVEDMGKREAEDLKVAKFYHSTGNYMAAYLRAKDALKIDPEDPEAQLALAINAQKLAKREDAIAGYTNYLKLAPDGDAAQTAKKALAALQ